MRHLWIGSVMALLCGCATAHQPWQPIDKLTIACPSETLTIENPPPSEGRHRFKCDRKGSIVY